MFYLLSIIFSFLLCQNSGIASGGSCIRHSIPIRDKTFNLIQKRKKEAENLIYEGIELKKKGYKEKNEELTEEGNLKKRIGTDALKHLREEELKHKNRDEVYVR